MNSFESKNCLEECMKDIVTEVNKKVRDSILLGKARVLNVNYCINQNKTITDQKAQRFLDNLPYRGRIKI